MRILLLSSVEYASGSGQRFRGLAGALARRGHDVHFVEPVPPGGVAETPAGVRRHACPRLPGRPEPQAPLWLLHGAAAVLRVRPEVCWCLKALPNAWLPARLAGRLGARVAVDLDDLDPAYYAPGAARRIVTRFLERALRAADDVTVHTEAMAARVRAARGPGRDAVFVEQGLAPGRFAPADPPPGVREALGLGAGPVLFYAGHLGPASDLGGLLAALGPVARARPDARLLVVGDGRHRAVLEARARAVLPAGFTVFAGARAPAEMPAWWALADVALNWLEENEANEHRASIKLREALASGVPVVTSANPDARRFAEWVRLPAGPGPDAFAAAVLEELAAPDRERARRGGAWLREHATHDVAVAEIARRWEGAE